MRIKFLTQGNNGGLWWGSNSRLKGIHRSRVRRATHCATPYWCIYENDNHWILDLKQILMYLIVYTIRGVQLMQWIMHMLVSQFIGILFLFYFIISTPILHTVNTVHLFGWELWNVYAYFENKIGSVSWPTTMTLPRESYCMYRDILFHLQFCHGPSWLLTLVLVVS